MICRTMPRCSRTSSLPEARAQLAGSEIAFLADQRLKAAEALLMADPFVQEMVRDFGAKIVPGSIKPL